MEITTPTTEQLAAIQAEHPERFPEAAAITVVGDRGASIRLPFVFGLPSGACKLPAAKKSPAWAEFISVVFKAATAASSMEDACVVDCLLYPNMAVYAEWCKRWPALPSAAWKAIKAKSGAMFDGVTEPALDDVPPSIAATVAANPQATLRRLPLRQNKQAHDVVLLVDRLPSSGWRFFLEAIRNPKSDHWKTVLEVAIGCTKTAADNGDPVDPFLIYERWPGAAILAVMAMSVLAGAAADYEVGEF